LDLDSVTQKIGKIGKTIMYTTVAMGEKSF
jgi:hypothetical protein